MRKWEYYKTFDTAYFELDNHKGDICDIQDCWNGGDVELSIECCCGSILNVHTTIDELKAIILAWEGRKESVRGED